MAGKNPKSQIRNPKSKRLVPLLLDWFACFFSNANPFTPPKTIATDELAHVGRSADKFTVSLFAILAQREREVTSERTRNALAALKSKGIKLGTPNPQKAVTAMITANKAAKVEFATKIYPIILEIKSAGVETLQGICECLNRRGIQTRNGKNWYPATVRHILKIQTT